MGIQQTTEPDATARTSVPPRIIRDNRTLLAQYRSLQAGDIVVGRLRLRDKEEQIVADLLERGVRFLPSARSQLCSRSKVLQARLLGEFMIPGTEAVYDRHDLLRVVMRYGREKRGAVICKLDRANGGQGILKYADIEDVFNQATLGVFPYPFVIQPFLPGCRDIRAVFLGEVTEAYTRSNPDNFRHNLHCGGTSTPHHLTLEQERLCREIMARADFPYAHIDLLITPAGETWLTEINLRGGLRGASLSQQDYLKNIEAVHRRLLAQLTA